MRRRPSSPLGAIWALVALLAASCSSLKDPPLPPPVEVVQACWVVRTDLASPESVDQVVREAVRAGFNTLLVQVRGRGDAWFASVLEPPPPVLEAGGFDPLRRLLRAAHSQGIAVQAWVNVDLIWDPDEPNSDERHVVHAHPEWLSYPAALAPRLLRMGPGPASTRALLEFVQAHRGEVEGLYGEPTQPAYRRHVIAVCQDLVARYPVQGLHLDFIRYPNEQWGYSARALELFRREVDQGLSAADRQDMAGRVLADALLYTRRYPRRWNSFRRSGLNALMAGVARACRAARPQVVISAAVFPGAQDAYSRRFQDWSGWLKKGWLDVACPMNYTTDRKLFEQRTRDLVRLVPRGHLWLGIGAWRLPPRETMDRVRWSRRQGVGGIVLFSQGGLRQKPGAFEAIRKGVFAAHAASPPEDP